MEKPNKTRNRRKANHECILCGKKLEDDYTYQSCEECRKKDSENQKAAKHILRELGICFRCGVNRASKGYKTCITCREIERERMQSPKGKVTYDRIKEMNKARYHRLKDQGICVACGKRKAVEGKIKCTRCYARQFQTRQMRLQYE